MPGSRTHPSPAQVGDAPVYEAGPGHHILEREMQRMIAAYEHDGCAVEYVRRSHASGYLVRMPADEDRFYATIAP